ncbi:hypothetical protein JKF63_06745 [Porcisia hertigi]|uniref:Uncharacterized protein n=1 Tax=Porcisia hertigi TaxID=2761500 RepID=A0A836LH46_9TRYP|nr:hypothetical protein JKF63_06745 [Porcisia hertigi]
MKGSVSMRWHCGGASQRLGSARPTSHCFTSSALRWHGLLLPSHRKAAVFLRNGTQRDSTHTTIFCASRRLVSSKPPSPAASPFSSDPIGQLRIKSGGSSGRMPSTSHSSAHCIDAQVVTQFAASLGSSVSVAQGRRSRLRPRQRHHCATVSRGWSPDPIAACTSCSSFGAGPPSASISANDIHPATPSLSLFPQTGKSGERSEMSPVLQQLCQLIGSGAWREALKVLHRHEEDTTTAQNEPASQEASSERHVCLRGARALAVAKGGGESPELPFVTVAEISVWLLLWCGHAAAAWYVWGRTILTTVSPPPSPQVVLLLAFFVHFVERDAIRTRDMLLLFKMMNASAPTPLREVEIREACEENPALSQRLGRRLFSQWLWYCNECTLGKRSLSAVHRRCLASFLEESVEQVVKCAFLGSATPARQQIDAMGETVALLLLALRDMSNTSNELRRIFKEELTAACVGGPKQDSRNGCQSASMAWPAGGNTKHSPLLAPSVYALMGDVVKSILQGAPPAASDLGSHEGHRTERRGYMRLRSIFNKAERDLKLLNGHWGPAVRPDGGNALEAFRMLQGHILESEGFGGTWAALRLSLHLPSTPSQHCSLGYPAAPAGAAGVSLQQLLRLIDDATFRGDWTTALRLCLNASWCGGCAFREGTNSSSVDAQDVSKSVRAPSRCRVPTPTSAPLDPFPFLHRLAKGLVACEVVRPPGASWQGAMALWHFARSYSHPQAGGASPPGIAAAAEASSRLLHVVSRTPEPAPPSLSLSHALGRIFFLLASAKRWAEALACFHDTPDAYLDGFVVSQVAYALRECPSQYRSVLDLWAAWRCRVGDAVDPTEDMTHKLLLAMLQTSVTATSPAATLSSTSFPSPSFVASEVATALLVAAADTSLRTLSTSTADVRRIAATPGSAVPMDWLGQRHLIRSVMMDRWVGSWTDALRVAFASRDVSLLVYAVLQRVPVAHVPSLCPYLRRALQDKTLVLSPAERVSLLALWTEGPQSPVGRDTGEGPGKTASPIEAAIQSNTEGGGARQQALNTEAFLDELLGF